MSEGGLGRVVEQDLNDLKYLMRAARPFAFEQPVEQLPSSMHYQRGPVLDQGRTGTCVGHSLAAKLAGAPVKVGPSRIPTPFAIYDEAIVLDEWKANDQDKLRQMGTSVRAGCKALEARGLITSYHWAYSVDDILHWILSGQGGVVLGIDWFSEMNQPNDEGIVRTRGKHQGGHAIYCFGADRKTGLIALQQSWGANHGGWIVKRKGESVKMNPGCIRLPLEDLHKLLEGNGEAVAIVEAPYVRRVVRS